MSEATKGVKAGQVRVALEKLGFTQTHADGLTERFENNDGESLHLPADPEVELLPRYFWHVLRDLRLRERQFWELLDEPSKKAS